jgi:hypothetical protein
MAESISSMQASKNTFPVEVLLFTIFSTPPIKLKLGLQILLYIGWLSTDQLFLELPNFLEKYVPTMPKI